jgi:outer membrane protein OmpA-like peptidoglycan-associated protein
MKQIITIFILSCLITAGCTTPGKKTAIGAGLGATGGAVLGAAVGSASGNAGKGALIGAATGAVVGGAVGNHLDKQAKELAQYAETRRTEEGIMVNLKGDILFESGKANLKPEAANRLKQIGTILAKYPEDRIVIVGHSDDAGNDAYNLRLSENRANAVRFSC